MPDVRKVTIQTNVLWRAFQSPTSSRWIAVCDELNLSLEGENEDELRSLIPEAIHLLMTDLLEENELEQYLSEKGWQASDSPVGKIGEIQFDVPWHLVAEGARRDPERRAH